MPDNDNKGGLNAELERAVAAKRALDPKIAAMSESERDRELLWQLFQKLERMGWDTDEEGLATLAALDRAWRRA